ncbi:DUF4376 domain-containing protein [Rhodopseudomonas sp. P2A-2r]|uniref:DUF4376 domain-containing protein n=1 Tax=Rhodopseudomonas sp. P2A-2r TaxID=2991972 RepID=UPI00223425F1|nr:DUF4376 domain-containing protein [Rhodopseudomonas sp. P2A-2r]UZE51130.1 DUF4376 domain-containing protein [Rhodopseudomonas sp. P2A-2r]
MAVPPLLAGANEQIYSQGRRHCYMAEGDIVAGGDMPWPDGDSIIAAIDLGLAAQALRMVPVPVAVDLLAYAKDASWRKEIGGVVIAGIPVATDDRSQLKILGSRVAADADPNWSTEWDAANDQTYPIDAATMIMISDAVAAHVNRCFSIRASVKAAIAAGTITTTAEIDAAFA